MPFKTGDGGGGDGNLFSIFLSFSLEKMINSVKYIDTGFFISSYHANQAACGRYLISHTLVYTHFGP